MNLSSTDTRIQRQPDDVIARHDRQRNDVSTLYSARHRHKPGPVSDQAAKAGVPACLPVNEQTQLIPAVPRELGAVTARIEAGQMLVRVPLAARERVLGEVPAAVVPVSPPEPVAPVTDALLKRILRSLRVMK